MGTVALTEGKQTPLWGDGAGRLIIALARQSTGICRVRNPGLPHHQEFVLVEDVCVVVESLLGLEPPQLTRMSLPTPSQLRSDNGSG